MQRKRGADDNVRMLPPLALENYGLPMQEVEDLDKVAEVLADPTKKAAMVSHGFGYRKLLD